MRRLLAIDEQFILWIVCSVVHGRDRGSRSSDRLTCARTEREAAGTTDGALSIPLEAIMSVAASLPRPRQRSTAGFGVLLDFRRDRGLARCRPIGGYQVTIAVGGQAPSRISLSFVGGNMLGSLVKSEGKITYDKICYLKL